MADTNPGTGLLNTAEKELSFRRRIVELLGGLLKSEAPQSFKAFVVILLFIGLSASFTFAGLILEIFRTIVSGPEHQDHIRMFAGILSGHCVAGVFTGIPFTMRMGDLEEARRLEGTLRRVDEIKKRKAKVETNGPIDG
jgi:hypothetical protein